MPPSCGLLRLLGRRLLDHGHNLRSSRPQKAPGQVDQSAAESVREYAADQRAGQPRPPPPERLAPARPPADVTFHPWHPYDTPPRPATARDGGSRVVMD